MSEKERIQQTRLYMRRWASTMEMIKRKEAEIATLWKYVLDARQTLQAQRITDMPRGTQVSDPTACAVEDLEKRIEEYQRANKDATDMICAWMAEKRMIDNLIDLWLTQFQTDIIYARYADKHDWEYLALKFHCDESTLRKQEYKALKKLTYRLNITPQ